MRRMRASAFNTERGVAVSATENAPPQENVMRNVYEVLREKESAVQRVAREIQILRLAAPLLVDDVTSNDVRIDTVPTNDADPKLVPASASGVPLTNEQDGAISGSPNNGNDEGSFASMKKISARLKRLTRPLGSASRLAAS